MVNGWNADGEATAGKTEPHSQEAWRIKYITDKRLQIKLKI